ncbi:conserved hypothetical protein [Vibrio chagasii]|nr:conserved hypothetical protein [Vibrio chagasii]
MMKTEAQKLVYGIALNIVTKHNEVSEKLSEVNHRLCNRQCETPESIAELQEDKKLLSETKDHLGALIKFGEEMESKRLRERFELPQ